MGVTLPKPSKESKNIARKVKKRTVLITGGTSGIGLATAKRFVENGDNVHICGTNRRRKPITSGMHFHKMDVRNSKEVGKTIEAIVKIDGLDIAFNNAGCGSAPSPIHETNEEEWIELIDTNLNGIFRCMQAELKAMLIQGHGIIVNNASIAGITATAGTSAAYIAAKHGVIGLTKSAANEYATQNIRINAISPGGTETRMTAASKETLKDTIPLHRLAKPEEIANAVFWLCSSEASFLHGTNLIADGGQTCKL